jgi:hypothetical protein
MNLIQITCLIFAILASVLPAQSSEGHAYRLEQISNFSGPLIIQMKPGRFKCTCVKQDIDLIAIEPDNRVQIVNRNTKQVAWEDIDTWVKNGAPTLILRPVVYVKQTRPLHEIKIAGVDCVENSRAAFMRDVQLSEYMQKVVLGVYRLGIDSRLLPVVIWDTSTNGQSKYKRIDTSKIERIKPSEVKIAYEKNFPEVPLMSIIKMDDAGMAIDILDSLAPHDKPKKK